MTTRAAIALAFLLGFVELFVCCRLFFKGNKISLISGINVFIITSPSHNLTINELDLGLKSLTRACLKAFN